MTAADNYEDYERECKAIREENEGHLKEFEDYLSSKGLSDKTIKRHISNVDFYINTYLLQYDAERIGAGCLVVNSYLGDFFIRKCMWSTPATIRQTAASFKKFYKCMLEKGHVTQADYDSLREEIKEWMPEWIETCEKYNDPSARNPFYDDFFDDFDDYVD